LPAGTIIIGWVGIADGGMIGTAVALDAPGEKSWEVCAETRLLCAQNNTKHSTEQRPRNDIAADVSGILAMQDSVLGPNQGEFKPNQPRLSPKQRHARRFFRRHETDICPTQLSF
jgi:hypothetical protein